jgi:hypothetical protein
VTLQRVWIPSPNYSSRGGSGVRLIVLHTAEGSTTYESLGNYFQQDVGVSSHVGIDDKRGKVGEYVTRGNKAWTQGNANPVAVSAELCGFASWSTSTWQNSHQNMLQNAAEWVAEEAAKFGLPITKLTSSQAQGSGRGVCQHIDLGSWGGGHVDCGSGFPMDYVLDLARGEGTSTPPSTPPAVVPAYTEEDSDMPTLLPGTNQPAVGISFTGAGEYLAVNLLGDVGTTTEKVTKIRVAAHHKGTPNWQVTTVTLNPSNPRAAVDFPGDCDGVSFTRLDDVAVSVVPMLKRNPKY